MWVEQLVLELFSFNVGLFLDNVDPTPFLFSFNVVPKSSCSRVGAFLLLGRYSYARILYAVAFKILGTQEETEEAVLDVFQQVWRTAGRYNPQKARVDAWLFMQIRSRALDRLRVKQRMAQKNTVSLDAVNIDTQAPTKNPEENVVVMERRRLIVTAMQQLPPEQRQVIELAYFKGFTHNEIATQTGVAIGTIKTRIRLALNKLRGALSHFDCDDL